MLRIDENSKTLVAPQAAGFVPEPPPARDELLALIAGGWQAFAAEIGHPNLKLIGASPEPGVDALAIDEASGRIVAVTVADGAATEALGRTLAAGAIVASWDADKLGAMHEALQTATPGDSPRLVIVGADVDPSTLMTVDWLVRRHGLELTAYGVQTLRFGAERMMNITRIYPAPDPGQAAATPDFFAQIAANSAPPPSVPAPPPAPAPAA